MDVMTELSSDYQPILLLPNIRYPTYQLHAFAGGRRGRGETVLKICILETMQWLRQRFRAFDLPAELVMPDPAAHDALDLAQLESFHLDLGYKLEVVWLPEPGLWVLQLTEPDLGARTSTDARERAPVPGRLFETNVSYRLTGEQVECAFRTVVHEPVGTDADCEVFRLAFIKHLARNAHVGLMQGWPIIDHAHVLTGKGDIRKLHDWLRDPARMLPAVVVAEYLPKKTPVSIFDIPKPGAGPISPYASLPPQRQPEPKEAVQMVSELPFSVADLARFKMGYAQIFVLPMAQRDVFADLTGCKVEPGGTLIIEPEIFASTVQRFPYPEKKHREALYQTIDEYVQNYPKGKDLSFGGCLFLTDAKDLAQKQVIELHKSVEEIAEAYDLRLRTLEDLRQHELSAQRTHLQEKEAKIQRLQDSIRRLEEDKDRLRAEIGARDEANRKRQAEQECHRLRQIQLQDRPQKPADVPAWVEKYFAGKMIFHERAQDMIQKVTPDRVNLPLLCDALEYLAEEYRDTLLGELHVLESNQRCSEKYGRPFTVVSDKGPSIEMFPAEYKIKYTIGFKGKPVDTALDLHLKVGHDPDNLLRIYFLYDKEQKRIVVGSLPEHLRTWTYR
jgi:hypothetical protein